MDSTNKQYEIYDYAIIGAGAAGLQLAHAMLQESYFSDKKILILEKTDKKVDDKTWSFWEKGNGKWDHLIIKSWEYATFHTPQRDLSLVLAPYQYKTLRSIDFYQHYIYEITQSDWVYWVKDEVLDIEQGDTLTIVGQKNKYFTQQIFDSRIEKKANPSNKYAYLAQHFKGWEIETQQPVFDPTTFVMMDFRIRLKDTTSFTYVLPFSPNRALVEFTLFTPDLIDKSEYDSYLEQYLSNILKISDYQIKKEEYGIIPMTDYPFHQANQKGIFKIGTAGSWVKPSSGYAFKNISRCANQLVQNILHQRPLHLDLLQTKFRLYDSVLLNVLTTRNELGPAIFEDMYTKNSIQQIFKFLDNETNVLEDLSIITSFQHLLFLKALGKHLKNSINFF